MHVFVEDFAEFLDKNWSIHRVPVADEIGCRREDEGHVVVERGSGVLPHGRVTVDGRFGQHKDWVLRVTTEKYLLGNLMNGHTKHFLFYYAMLSNEINISTELK